MSIEGRRCGPDGSLSPFKKGAVVMAISAGADIVPFMTMGEMRAWPAGFGCVLPSSEIDCIVFPPIKTEGLTYEDRDRVLAQLRSIAEDEKMSWEQQVRDQGNQNMPKKF